MKRKVFKSRDNWQQRCLDVGFDYFNLPSSDGSDYWSDKIGYEFTLKQIDYIEDSTKELHDMCLDFVTHTIKSGDYPKEFLFEQNDISLIEHSWNTNSPSLMGRFDFAYDGESLKMLEYNADTPTSLLEASVVQWHWVEEVEGIPNRDQFNSIHEELVKRFEYFKSIGLNKIHFSAMESAGREDWGNVEYLMECAVQAGIIAKELTIENIGVDYGFVDLNGHHIQTLFKLYPWEWMIKDDFSKDASMKSTNFIEPAWKLLLSNKALLPYLWKRNEKNPLLLESHFSKDSTFNVGDWVKKPLLSREGANVSRVSNGVEKQLSGSEFHKEYDDSGYILQKWIDLPYNNGMRPVIGSWVVGETACGIGIREDYNDVTGNDSHFIPHYFVE